jgi:hypothetical protein
MTAADERRAQAAAQEALNRIADDVIAGRIDGSAQREAPAQPYPAEHYAADPYAAPQYAEAHAEPHAAPAYAPVEHYPPEAYAQPQPANPYAQPYTHEQAAADAYAAQFAAGIGQAAVASAAQPQYAPPPFVAPVQAAAPTPVEVVVKPEPARTGLLTYFTVAVALLSLAMSLYQGYLFHRSIDLMEKNVARGEFIRTCRDIIGTYFDVKQKVGAMMPAADRGNVAGASRITENTRLDAQSAIARFGGLGTYLANFQDVSTRVRYTELTKTLNGIMDVARTTPLTDIDRLFTPADRLFADMNNDCVKLSQTMRM